MAKANTPTNNPNLVASMRPPYAYKHLPFVVASDVDNTVLMRSLYRALQSKRPNGSMAEARFAAWVATQAGATMIDTAGNIHVDRRTSAAERTMFTSHTDTVHHEGGTNNIRLDTTNPERVVWRADEGQCLGADDGAGVALMMHMLDAGVPGYYIFFRGEECGGIGSTWLADNMRQLLKQFDRCISFDRADQQDVITHQGGERCCSDTFAYALADALLDDAMTLTFAPCDTGVFTDSANLTHLIPECTNLSVGYKHQHGDGEYQDVTFLRRLAAQLVQVQWEALPTSRDPSAPEPSTRYTYDTYQPSTWRSNHDSVLDDFDKDVLDALEDAAFGRHRPLELMVGEWLSPENALQGARHVDIRKVDRAELMRYANGIRQGAFDSSTVVEILSDDCYKE